LRPRPPSTFAALVGAFALAAGCSSATTPPRLSAAALRDPAACQECHPTQFADWSVSVHASAADDPVFLAMNQRAQRESVGANGTFCVNCHAPLAVRDGLTKDGLNLATLPRAEKGVTCYFCHAVEAVAGTHDDPLVLAMDDSLFGPFADPVAGTPHAGLTSALFNDTSPQSAAMCGSCHDIVNQHGAAVERTFSEWQATLFSKPMIGLSCMQCHMDSSQGAASTISTRTRTLHRHDFPGVDLPPQGGTAATTLRARAQTLLDTTVQSTLCWNPTTSQIEVTLDNVGAGHGFPSGATPDRRAWVEVTAYAGANVIYSSGGAAATPLEASPDPDLWLVRDCLADGAKTEVRLFWQAATDVDDELPGAVSANVNDPASFTGHRERTFPAAGGMGLPQTPDRITLQVHVEAIGDDVLTDLVGSGDLDPAVPATLAKYDLGTGAALEWTPAKAVPETDARGIMKACVLVPGARYNAMVTPAATHATCSP
jgi:Cytochrome c554 and c-prime